MGTGLMVAFLCNAHTGGGEEHAHQIAKRLTTIGQDITYVTMSCPHPNKADTCPDPQELERFERDCGYPIERIYNSVIGSRRFRSPSAIYGRLRVLWNLYRIVRRKRAEYIVVNQSNFLSTLCLIVAKVARIPMIQIVHHLVPGDFGPNLHGRLSKWFTGFNMRAADVNVCVSRFTASDVVELTGSPRVITSVIYNAVDLGVINNWRADFQGRNESMAAAIERGYPNGHGPVILTVAGLSEHKGIQWVIKAMPKILSEFPDAHYVVAGDGGYRPELEHLVEDTLPPHLRHTVTFLGRVSDSEKYACYDMCDVFAMPSSEEGFGLVYVEAAAFGKPSVGCDVMGVPEAIADGETGLLVGPADGDKVANAVLRLLRNESERMSMGQNGRRRVESQLSWDASARKYQQVINELSDARQSKSQSHNYHV